MSSIVASGYVAASGDSIGDVCDGDDELRSKLMGAAEERHRRRRRRVLSPSTTGGRRTVSTTMIVPSTRSTVALRRSGCRGDQETAVEGGFRLRGLGGCFGVFPPFA
jgi:hypothetical protein